MSKKKKVKKESKKAVKSLDKPNNNFALIVKHSRTSEGEKMTLKDIQRGAGVSYPVLNHLKYGHRTKFNHRTIDAICQFLGVTKEELFVTYVPPVKADEGDD